MEATRNWYWMSDFIEGIGLKPILAHPKKVRIIAEATVKTDKIDSKVLAHLERVNFLPMSYIPTKEIRDVRELLRYRMSLVVVRTSLKNRAHSVLAKMGVRNRSRMLKWLLKIKVSSLPKGEWQEGFYLCF